VALTPRTPEQQVWGERLRRRHRAQILLDVDVRRLGAELRRAVADVRLRPVGEDGLAAVGEAMAPILDWLGEHLGVGPRPR
jgi:hypothetical protein